MSSPAWPIRWVFMLAFTYRTLAIIGSAQRSDAIQSYRLTAGQLGIALTLIAGIIGGYVVERGFSPQALEAGIRKDYPAAAAALMESRRYEGPLYNH